MKLKNTMNDIRQLRINGQVVTVGPFETIEIESNKVAYDNVVFKIVETRKRNEKAEKQIKLEEDK
jgi:homoserine trans-succinylase